MTGAGSYPSSERGKGQRVLRIPKKLLVAAMGLGIVGLLGSAGTFALFTASTFNPMNDFASGSLLLADTTSFTSAASTLNEGRAATAPNQSGTDPRGTLAECATPIVAQVCTTLMKSVNVAAAGIAPGQYLRATISINNGGTVPATMALQVQNVKTSSGNGTTGFNPCTADIVGAAAPGTSGPQLTTGATTGTNYAGAVPLTGCLDLGRALRITVQDAGANGTGPQCLFGNDLNGGANGGNVLQAPIPGAFTAGVAGLSLYTASGTKAASGSGVCDDLSQPALLGRPNSPVLPGSNPKDGFGTQGGAPSNSSFAGLSGSTSMIFIPGGSTARSVVNTPELAGNLTNIPQWSVAETHSFTLTLALPDTGSTSITDHNNNRYSVSNDNPYQGGTVSFDLYWFGIQ